MTFALSGRRIVLMDLLGVGESPKPWNRYCVERHVAARHASQAAERSVTLVGLSLGAALALVHAA